MKFPALPRPWLWRPRRADSAATSAPLRGATEEDVRLLRRTRLRLMAVSGVVTMIILVALGVAAYGAVAYALDDADKKAFTAYTSRHLLNPPSSTGPETSELAGEGANVFEIDIWPDGQVHPPRYQTIPPGLPNKASLTAAAASSSGTDERSITGPDGTPYHIMSVRAVYLPSGGVGLVQFVQNRTAEARLLTTLFWTLLGGGVVVLLASLLAGYFYAGRALVPIRQSIDRRQAALQRQREFAANASHELRTPLTVIRASVEDLKRNRRSKVEDVGEAIGDIDAEVGHMTALVEDMLTLARTDSGVVQVEHLPLDLSDVAAEAASMLVTLGQERGVSVVLDPLPARVIGDPLRLRQLVTILVDNAIRHSSKDSTVAVWVRPEPASALLQVDDHGPGVKPEDLPRLFDRFWRADNAPAGGTGLGLAIAKWIVEQHGGTIGAFNRPDGGASFWVRLPGATEPGSVVAAIPAVDDFDDFEAPAAPWSPSPDVLPSPGAPAAGNDVAHGRVGIRALPRRAAAWLRR
jgi:signal transduction histidine kinase